MDAIKAVLFEPVGCLAEFRVEDFNAAAAELFAATGDAPANGSQAYWRLVRLIEQRPDARPARLQELELRAVDHADLYPDVGPSLAEIRDLGVATVLVSSLSRPAVTRFIERFSLADLFAGTVSRDEAGGVAALPLRHVIDRVSLDPQRTMVLVDTAEALAMTRPLGLNAMLMINDYDEGRALATQSPAGGIVSLAELADALRLIDQQSGMRQTSRAPREPFELFDPT